MLSVLADRPVGVAGPRPARSSLTRGALATAAEFCSVEFEPLLKATVLTAVHGESPAALIARTWYL